MSFYGNQYVVSFTLLAGCGWKDAIGTFRISIRPQAILVCLLLHCFWVYSATYAHSAPMGIFERFGLMFRRIVLGQARLEGAVLVRPSLLGGDQTGSEVDFLRLLPAGMDKTGRTLEEVAEGNVIDCIQRRLAPAFTREYVVDVEKRTVSRRRERTGSGVESRPHITQSLLPPRVPLPMKWGYWSIIFTGILSHQDLLTFVSLIPTSCF